MKMAEKRNGFLRFLAQQEKMPYLLTLLIALCGWGFTHIVDRLLQSPVVEYEMATTSAENGSQTLRCTITNISRDRLFQDITFKLLPHSPKYRFSKCKMTIFPPADLEENLECDADYITFAIPEFQPGWRLQVVAELSAKAAGSAELPEPTLQFTSTKTGNTAKPLRLIRRSWETLFVRYENTFVLLLILCWCLLISGYSFYLYRARNRDLAPGGGKEES